MYNQKFKSWPDRFFKVSVRGKFAILHNVLIAWINLKAIFKIKKLHIQYLDFSIAVF